MAKKKSTKKTAPAASEEEPATLNDIAGWLESVCLRLQEIKEEHGAQLQEIVEGQAVWSSSCDAEDASRDVVAELGKLKTELSSGIDAICNRFDQVELDMAEIKDLLRAQLAARADGVEA